MKQIFFLLCFLSVLIGCQNEPKSTANTTAEVYPTTPEGVVRLWQKYIDNNEFEPAKKLSTARGQEWIGGIEMFLKEENLDSMITNTDFLNMNCVENGADAFCVYLFKDEDSEIFQDTFFLKKENNQWVVDIPEDEGVPTEEELMEFF